MTLRLHFSKTKAVLHVSTATRELINTPTAVMNLVKPHTIDKHVPLNAQILN